MRRLNRPGTSKRTGAAGQIPDEATLHVILIEKRLAVGEALKLVLEQQGVASVTVAETTEKAAEIQAEIEIGVVVIDIGEIDIDPPRAAQQLLHQAPGLGLIAVSSSHTDEDLHGLRTAGYRGFVRKDAPLEELIDVIFAVGAGHTVIQEPRSPASRVSRGAHENALLLGRQLTLREHEVLTLLVQGASGTEIARELGITTNTVRTHVQNVMTKLQVHSRIQAVMFAVTHGLVAVPGRDEDISQDPI